MNEKILVKVSKYIYTCQIIENNKNRHVKCDTDQHFYDTQPFFFCICPDVAGMD